MSPKTRQMSTFLYRVPPYAPGSVQNVHFTQDTFSTHHQSHSRAHFDQLVAPAGDRHCKMWPKCHQKCVKRTLNCTVGLRMAQKVSKMFATPKIPLAHITRVTLECILNNLWHLRVTGMAKRGPNVSENASNVLEIVPRASVCPRKCPECLPHPKYL